MMLKVSFLSLSDKFWRLLKAGDIVPLADFAVTGNNINHCLGLAFNDSVPLATCADFNLNLPQPPTSQSRRRPEAQRQHKLRAGSSRLGVDRIDRRASGASQCRDAARGRCLLTRSLGALPPFQLPPAGPNVGPLLIYHENKAVST